MWPYDIGYSKPPTHAQFVKGKSGNPKGRPKGRKAFKTVLANTMAEYVTVTENGQKKGMSRMEALAKHLVARALIANPAALRVLFPLILELEKENDQPGMRLPRNFERVFARFAEDARTYEAESAESNSTRSV
jgi:hypothetical protein